MDTSTFNHLIHSSADRGVSLAELGEAVRAYPWCQPLRVLASVRAHADGDPDRTQYLGLAAVHTFYRPRLRQLHQPYLGLQPAVKEAPKRAIRRAPAAQEPTIDLVAEVSKEEPTAEPELLPQPQQQAKVQRPAPIKDPAKTDDQARLIDEFLATQEGIRPARREPLPEAQGDLAAKSASFDGLIISETMARMYMRQGQPQKAAYIVSQLSLKFPEKSAYFAQILETGGQDS